MQTRPTFLTRFAISALTLQLDVDNGGAFNEDIEVTVPAGDYYMSWDMQDDDFLYVLMTAISAALQAQATSGNYNGNDSSGKLVFWIDSDHKVNVRATDGVDIRIAWTEDDGETIADILGFDGSSDLDLDTDLAGRTATATWQHAYAWYADEDGYTANESREDVDDPRVRQSVAPGGEVKTVFFASTLSNMIQLEHVPREKTWSRQVGYTEDPVWPYEKNVPLECWWQEARQGIPFRVYRHNQIDTSLANETGTLTGQTTTTATDGNKSWNTDPQRFAGALYYSEEFGPNEDLPVRYYIESHTGTALTMPNALLNTNLTGSPYFIFKQRYGTYVLDTAKTSTFNPNEQNPATERHSFMVHLRKYVAA